MSKPPAHIDHFLHEHVLCGGLVYTREHLYRELIGQGSTAQEADAYAFGYLKAVEVTAEIVEQDQILHQALAEEIGQNTGATKVSCQQEHLEEAR